MVTRFRFLFWAGKLRFSSYFSAPALSWSETKMTRLAQNCPVRKLLFNESNCLGKKVDSKVSAVWLGGRKRRPFHHQWTLRWPQLSCTISLFPENSYSWVSKSLLEASLPKWRIQYHRLLYTCSLQVWVSAFFSNKKWWLWNYLLKRHKHELPWGKGNRVLNLSGSPQVVFYLLLCKQNVVVLNDCQWEFNRDSYSVQITVIMVLELDYPLKKAYCRTLEIMLWNIVKTELYLPNEQRTYCSAYYTFSTCISSLSTIFWISPWV